MSNASIGAIVAMLNASPARCGDTRVVLIDGPAGAGKTTLASRLRAAVATNPPAQILHADDMYEGWEGLPTLDAVLVDQVLVPLSRSLPASWRRWDWQAGKRTDVIAVAACNYLIVEGVGVAQRRARPFASVVVYVDAPVAERLRRGVARDGARLRSEWVRWQEGEATFLVQEGTRGAADVILDGTRVVPD